MSATQYRHAWDNTGQPLPRFLSHPSSPVKFYMTIAFRHPSEQLRQGIVLPPSWLHHDLPSDQRDIHHRPLVETDIPCHRPGNPQGEAIAPLLDHRVHVIPPHVM